MRPDVEDLRDIELRLVDPTRNRFRIYGLTECVTLFGELCLHIVWGRIGNRRLRERSEVFADRAALVQRRDGLLRRRRRHGYRSTTTPVPDDAELRRGWTPLPFLLGRDDKADGILFSKAPESLCELGAWSGV